MYRHKMPIEEPVRSFGDRFGYWFNDSHWAGASFLVGIVGIVGALTVGSYSWGKAADARRDIAMLEHDEAIAKGVCRDVWISTADRATLACPHPQHHLTANASWVRCECRK